MRDKNLNLQQFISNLEGRIQVLFGEKFKTLRNHVVDNPNFLEAELQLHIPKLNLKDFIKLAIAQWYAPEEIKFLINLELNKQVKHFSQEDQFLLSQLLKSKARMILFLIHTSLYHTRDLFGNVLSSNLYFMRKIKFRKEMWKVIKPQRKRGYHDHGHRVLEHIFKESRFIHRSAEIKMFEEKEKIYQDTQLFCKGLLS